MTIDFSAGDLIYVALTALGSVFVATIIKPLSLLIIDFQIDMIVNKVFLTNATARDIQRLWYKIEKLKGRHTTMTTKVVKNKENIDYYIGSERVSEKKHKQFIDNFSSDQKELVDLKYSLQRKSDRLNWLLRRFDQYRENPIEAEIKEIDKEEVPRITQNVCYHQEAIMAEPSVHSTTTSSNPNDAKQ